MRSYSLLPLWLTCLSIIYTSTATKQKCKDCREVVSNFVIGYKNTSRTMYDGGDTDWELRNMGDYRKSEIRLIEITEAIFKLKSLSDSQHRFLEDAEEDIETWWMDKWDHQDISVLENHLCVTTRKLCCAHGSYGSECLPCLSGPDSDCSGHGTCNGNGTKEGTGKCDCEKGYAGDFCESCKKGYERDSSENCQDIDECQRNASICDSEPGKYCHNNPGYYSCKKCHPSCESCFQSASRDDCRVCNEGFIMTEDGCKTQAEILEEERKAAEEAGNLEEDQEVHIISIAVYTGLVVIAGGLFSRYNKVVAVTMAFVSFLFALRHRDIFFAVHDK